MHFAFNLFLAQNNDKRPLYSLKNKNQSIEKAYKLAFQNLFFKTEHANALKPFSVTFYFHIIF